MKTLLFTITALFLLAGCDQPTQNPDKAAKPEVANAKRLEAPDKKETPGAKAKAMVAAGAQLIDVRSTGEFSGGGIEGAKNIPISEFAQRINEVDKTKPVVVYCASGMRSAKAKDMLEKAGYTNVFNMGGMHEW